MEKLFDYENCNKNILVVPQEEGGTEDDISCSSIGDATQKHVSSLSNPERQLWQELILTKNGNIFVAEDSLNQYDDDIFSVRGESVDTCINQIARKMGKKLDKSSIEVIREVLEREAEERQKSEDIYDRADPIPYHKMEQYPGLVKCVDIPQSPKNALHYMGNISQQFYDTFPAGHPDEIFINSFLNMINRDDIFELDDRGTNDSWKKWLRKKIFQSGCCDHVKFALFALINNIFAGNNLTDSVNEALIRIDDCWRSEYQQQAYNLSQKDPVLQLLITKEQEWRNLVINGTDVYPIIKRFGALLYKDFKGQVKSYHWARYHQIKKKFAPRVNIRGYDLNRCSVYDIQLAMQVDKELAIKIWINRPYDNLEAIFIQHKAIRKTFMSNLDTQRIIIALEKASSLSIIKNSATELYKIKHYILDSQDKFNLTRDDWKVISSYFNILKKDVLKNIQNNRKNNGQEKTQPRSY